MKICNLLPRTVLLLLVACETSSPAPPDASPVVLDDAALDTTLPDAAVPSADASRLPLSIALDAPRVVRRGAPGQYAFVTPVEGATFTWSLSNATETTLRPGTSLVLFDPSPSAEDVRFAVEVSTGEARGQAEFRAPVMSPTRLSSERTMLAAGSSLVVLPSLLRGQRILARTEPATEMQWLDFQGRLIRSGDGLVDARAPVRGSYLLHLPSHEAVSLEVVGAEPQTGSEESMMGGASTPAQPMAIAGVFDERLLERPGLSTGESLIRAGTRVIEASYDYETNRARVAAYEGASRVWEWTSPDDDYIRSLAADAEGSVYAVGSTGPAGGLDASFVAKIDAEGRMVYRTVLSTAAQEFAYGISVDAGGRAYVSGMSLDTVDGSIPAGDLDAFVVVLDGAGSPIARRSFGTPASDRVFASCPLADGAMLFGDSSGAIGTFDPALGPGGGVDLFLARVDATGAPVFIRRFGSNGADLAFSCGVDGAGGLYFHGMTRGSLTGEAPPEVTQVYLFRASADGELAWVRQLGPSAGQSAEAIDVGPEGISMLFYTNGSFPGGSNTSQGSRASDDAVVARYTTDGTLEWVRQFYGTHERIFARGVAAVGGEVFVLQDHVYVPGAPFVTVSLDRFAVP